MRIFNQEVLFVSNVNILKTTSATVIYGIFVFFISVLVLPTIMTEKQPLQAVIEGNGIFTQKLYKILAKNPGNVFFSPISAHIVLSMAYQGSKGSTTDAFSSALNLPDPNATAEGYKDVMSHLKNVPNVTLLLANKIFIQDKYGLQTAFKDAVEKQFLSEVDPVDFNQSVAAAKTINDWVEEQTKSKIKDLIDPSSLDADSRLVLVNAIYFKGNWAEQFDPAQTKTDKFYLNDVDTVDVQMMFRRGKYNFKIDEQLNAKVLELPYSNAELRLILILPNERDGIDELEEKLANIDITEILEGMFNVEVNVRVPRFKIETTIELEAPLTELGLGVIFGRDANFTGMIDPPEPLFVSKAIQKAFIEVNEEGAEAAAATGLVISFRMALIPQLPEEFRADHPFIIILIDREGENNHVLFEGRVSNPA